MSDKEELDRLPRNLKILALHRKKFTRVEHEKKKDLVNSWISEQNFKDRFVKNPKTSKNDQDCSNKVKRKELVKKNGKRILAEVTNRKEDRKLTTLEPENTSQKINISSIFTGKRHCDLFSSNTRKPDYDEQIKIFIGSLDNSEQKWSLHEYWQNSKKHSDYRGQKFLDDLIENKFNYM